MTFRRRPTAVVRPRRYVDREDPERVVCATPDGRGNMFVLPVVQRVVVLPEAEFRARYEAVDHA